MAGIGVLQRLAVDLELALLEALQPVDAAQQRALARAALADDGHHLAGAHLRSMPLSTSLCRSACAAT
jgi:hypothetical protein